MSKKSLLKSATSGSRKKSFPQLELSYFMAILLNPLLQG